MSLKEVLAELGELAGAGERRLAHQHGRAHLEVAELACVSIEHEIGQGALEPRERPAQNHEAGARELGRALEIHQTERLADVEMLLGHEIEGGRLADFADFPVGALVLAHRHVVRGLVGQTLKHRPKFVRSPALLPTNALVIILEPADLFD